MKVLLPVLSGKENNEAFLSEALKGAKELVLILVIDKDAMTGQFGFAAGEIMQGTTIIEKLKFTAKKKRIKTEDVIEWGDTARKIENIAQIKQVEKIVLVEQKNQYFEKLLVELKSKLKIPVEVIKAVEPVQEPQPPKKLEPRVIGDILFGKGSWKDEIKKV